MNKNHWTKLNNLVIWFWLSRKTLVDFPTTLVFIINTTPYPTKYVVLWCLLSLYKTIKKELLYHNLKVHTNTELLIINEKDWLLINLLPKGRKNLSVIVAKTAVLCEWLAKLQPVFLLLLLHNIIVLWRTGLSFLIHPTNIASVWAHYVLYIEDWEIASL